ncbi:MAG: hypothetical protein KH260_08905 [Lachnospiraceae bacterium oral taxon 082]|nr:hypothetical protein [Lachnospiraceae bacterium oral taxon 082]
MLKLLVKINQLFVKKSRRKLTYRCSMPNALITQMDTVCNNETTGPFIQTFKFIPSGILFALYQTEKTSTAMKNGVDTLEDILGDEVFRKYVNVLLTDRGSEFYNVIFL